MLQQLPFSRTFFKPRMERCGKLLRASYQCTELACGSHIGREDGNANAKRLLDHKAVPLILTRHQDQIGERIVWSSLHISLEKNSLAYLRLRAIF